MTESRSARDAPIPVVGGQDPLAPLELATWLSDRIPGLKERWLHDIRGRALERDAAMNDVLEMFVAQLVFLLPLLVGPHRDQIQPLWDRASELFGSVAAKRGLAAGESIEELQILRELVIRDLYRDPPLGGSVPLSLREILRLNRAIDRAVIHASVGHTDAMFFQLFEADREVDSLSPADVAAEATAQLTIVEEEVREILAYTLSRASVPHRRN